MLVIAVIGKKIIPAQLSNRAVFSSVFVVVRHFEELRAGLNNIRENPCCQNVATGCFSRDKRLHIGPMVMISCRSLRSFILFIYLLTLV